MKNASVVDMFCGAGGLTHGFIKEGFSVVAGIDIDPSCKYPYEQNNEGAEFIERGIDSLAGSEIQNLFSSDATKILVGCAPCQPFSKYAIRKTEDGKWKLLYSFAKLIEDVRPDIVSMENVPGLARPKKYPVFSDFVRSLESNGYHVSHFLVYCPDYGIPQTRTRLVLFASKFGLIDLISKTHSPKKYRTVEDVIGNLRPIAAGEIDARDPMHRTAKLSLKNKERIANTPEGGGWKNWKDDLLLDCHKKESGKTYGSVYGRMKWDEPASTITTQCYGIGNGRFGHPTQDRAISLREAALFQTFPRYYRFIDPDRGPTLRTLGMQIGNAVPVRLGRVIAKSIRKHLELQNV